MRNRTGGLHAPPAECPAGVTWCGLTTEEPLRASWWLVVGTLGPVSLAVVPVEE